MAATTALRNMTAKQRRDVYRGDMMASMARMTPRSMATSERATPASTPRSMITSGADKRFGMPRDECAQGKHSASDAKRKKLAKAYSATRPETPLASPSSAGSQWGESPRRLRPGEDEHDTGASPFFAESPGSANSQFSNWLSSPSRTCQVEPGELSPPPAWSPNESAFASPDDIDSPVGRRFEGQGNQNVVDSKPASSSSSLASHLSMSARGVTQGGQQLPGRSMWLVPSDVPPEHATGGQRIGYAKDSPGAMSFSGESTTTGGFNREAPSAASSTMGAPGRMPPSQTMSPQAAREIDDEIPSASRSMLAHADDSYASRRAADAESTASTPWRAALDRLSLIRANGSSANPVSALISGVPTYAERRAMDENRRRTLPEVKAFVSKASAIASQNTVTPLMLAPAPGSYAERRAFDEQGIPRASTPVVTQFPPDSPTQGKIASTPGTSPRDRSQRSLYSQGKLGSCAYPSTPPRTQQQLLRCQSTPPRCLSESSMSLGSGRPIAFTNRGSAAFGQSLSGHAVVPSADHCCSQSLDGISVPDGAKGADAKNGKGIRTQMEYAGGGPAVLNGSVLEGELERNRLRSLSAQTSLVAASPCSRQPSPDGFSRCQPFDSKLTFSSQGVADAMTWTPRGRGTENQNCECAGCKPFSPKGEEAGQHSLLMQQNRLPRCHASTLGATKQESSRQFRSGSDMLTHEGQSCSVPKLECSSSEDMSDPAGNYARSVDRGRHRASPQSQTCIQDDATGGIAPCLAERSQRQTEAEANLCGQTKGSGLGAVPSDYQHKLTYRKDPMLWFFSSGKRCVSSPPPDSTLVMSVSPNSPFNPRSPSVDAFDFGVRRNALGPRRRRMSQVNDLDLTLEKKSLLQGSGAKQLIQQSGSPDSPQRRRRKSQVNDLELSLDDETRQRKQALLQSSEMKHLIQQSGREPDAISCSPDREKRQELLRGTDVGRLVQNEGYHQAVEEMRGRLGSDPIYAEQCRIHAAARQENADMARVVKERCHRNVCNVASHLQWNDAR